MADARTDSRLVQAARKGDRNAFGVLVQRHLSRVRALARRMLGGQEEAEDVTQEALLTAYLGLDKLRDPARFGSWLCGITVNVAKMRLRQRRKRLLEAPHAAAFDTATEAREILRAVQEALVVLPTHERRAVLMHYLEGLSPTEIAALLGESPGAVRVRLHRARQRLRAELAPFAPQVRQRREVTEVVEVQVEDVVVRMLKDEAEKPRLANERERIVLLRERNGPRVLPIWVGADEGDALVLQLGGEATPRPLTVDLTARLLEALGARVERVLVNRLHESTFYATIMLANGSGQEIDARPSDALNLAMRLGAPIFVDDDVMERGFTGEIETGLDRERERFARPEEPPWQWESLSLELVKSLREWEPRR